MGRDSRRLLSLLAAAIAAAGCPGQGSVSAMVGAEGGIIETKDGQLRLTVPPGALEGTFELRVSEVEPPPGAIGKAWRLEPSGLHFLLPVSVEVDGADPGLFVSYLDAGVIPLETNIDGRRASASVAHFTIVGLARPAPLATRGEVAQLIRSAYVPLLFTQTTIVTGPEAPLVQGDVVREQAIRRFARPGEPEADPFQYPIDRPTWFFWVDLRPGQLFTHENMYLFVDPATGVFREERALWPPVINGDVVETGVIARVESPSTVYAGQGHEDEPFRERSRVPAELGMATSAITVRRQALTQCSGEAARVFIGAPEAGVGTSASIMQTYLRGVFGGGNVSSARAIRRSDVTDVLDALPRPNDPCLCELFLYFASHGGDGGMVFTDNLGRGPPVQGDKSTAGSLAEQLGYLQLFNAMKNVCAVKTTLLIESCQAASAIEEAKADRARFATDGATLFGTECLDNFTVIAASDVGHAAPQRSRTLRELLAGDDAPFLFTETFIEEMAGKGRDFAGVGEALEAFASGVLASVFTDIGGQDPITETFSKLPNATCPCRCCDDEPPPVGLRMRVPQSRVTFAHDGFTQVRTHQCPTRLATVVEVINEDSEAIRADISTSTSALAAVPATLQLEPGTSSTFALDLSCTPRRSFLGSIDVSGTGLLTGSTVRPSVEFEYTRRLEQEDPSFVLGFDRLRTMFSASDDNRCGREITRLGVENTGAQPITGVASTTSPEISLTPSSFSLEPGTFTEISIALTCASPSSFTATIEVTATGATSGMSKTRTADVEGMAGP